MAMIVSLFNTICYRSWADSGACSSFTSIAWWNNFNSSFTSTEWYSLEAYFTCSFLDYNNWFNKAWARWNMTFNTGFLFNYYNWFWNFTTAWRFSAFWAWRWWASARNMSAFFATNTRSSETFLTTIFFRANTEWSWVLAFIT